MSHSEPSEPSKKTSQTHVSPSQKISTGDFWTDLGLALKRINPSEDLSSIGQIPCARNSLLSGIASGVGVGFIRGMTTGPWIASNWAMGTFIFISIGTWQICRTQVANEHKRMRVLVDSLPRLRRKPAEELDKEESP